MPERSKGCQSAGSSDKDCLVNESDEGAQARSMQVVFGAVSKYFGVASNINGTIVFCMRYKVYTWLRRRHI